MATYGVRLHLKYIEYSHVKFLSYSRIRHRQTLPYRRKFSWLNFWSPHLLNILRYPPNCRTLNYTVSSILRFIPFQLLNFPLCAFQTSSIRISNKYIKHLDKSLPAVEVAIFVSCTFSFRLRNNLDHGIIVHVVIVSMATSVTVLVIGCYWWE